MSSESSRLPRFGVGVLVLKDNHVLLGLRKGSHGSGLWAAPGGDLEYGEKFEASARRELAEECGSAIQTKDWRFIMVANFPEYDPHYVILGFVCEWVSGEVINGEPDKKERWEWWPLDALPENLLGGAQAMIKAYKSGTVYQE